MINMRIYTNAESTRKMKRFYISRGRSESSFRIFCIYPEFNAMTLRFFRKRLNFFAGRYKNLLPDKIYTTNIFCHGMLNLNPSIHFHKVEIFVLIQQKFNGPGTFIINRLGTKHGSLSHFFSQCLVKRRRRGFLN